ncbi:MAG: hypothetical protein ABID54_03460 [Pseudomonadota bacterium]
MKQEYSRTGRESNEIASLNEIGKIAQEGARKILQEALALELSSFLERKRYERKGRARNGPAFHSILFLRMLI